jgi:hypothetical protein
MSKVKNGPARQYDDAELEHFARFREERERVQPVKCDYGKAKRLCWVAMGPPAINPSGYCLGCGGGPSPLARVTGET